MDETHDGAHSNTINLHGCYYPPLGRTIATNEVSRQSANLLSGPKQHTFCPKRTRLQLGVEEQLH